jgi:hypothetical protein
MPARANLRALSLVRNGMCDKGLGARRTIFPGEECPLFWQQLAKRTVRLARRRQRPFSDEVDGCPLKRMT